MLLASLDQAFKRELTQRLEQVKARQVVLLVAGEEAFFDQRRQTVQCVDATVGGNVGGRVLGEAPGEHAEASKERLLSGLQQVIAPGKRGAHRLLASRQIAPPAREQGQRLIEARQHGLRRQHARPCGGQFDGQGKAVQAAAYLRDRGAIVGVDAEVRTHFAGALFKQGHAGRQAALADGIEPQRRHGLFLLAAHLKGFARGDEDLEAGTRRGDAGDRRRGAQHLLEVVEHQERVLATQVGDEHLLDVPAAGGQRDFEGRLNGRQYL